MARRRVETLKHARKTKQSFVPTLTLPTRAKHGAAGKSKTHKTATFETSLGDTSTKSGRQGVCVAPMQCLGGVAAMPSNAAGARQPHGRPSRSNGAASSAGIELADAKAAGSGRGGGPMSETGTSTTSKVLTIHRSPPASNDSNFTNLLHHGPPVGRGDVPRPWTMGGRPVRRKLLHEYQALVGVCGHESLHVSEGGVSAVEKAAIAGAEKEGAKQVGSSAKWAGREPVMTTHTSPPHLDVNTVPGCARFSLAAPPFSSTLRARAVDRAAACRGWESIGESKSAIRMQSPKSRYWRDVVDTACAEAAGSDEEEDAKRGSSSQQESSKSGRTMLGGDGVERTNVITQTRVCSHTRGVSEANRGAVQEVQLQPKTTNVASYSLSCRTEAVEQVRPYADVLPHLGIDPPQGKRASTAAGLATHSIIRACSPQSARQVSPSVRTFARDAVYCPHHRPFRHFAHMHVTTTNMLMCSPSTTSSCR
jgi:hypothetical protein